MKSRELNMTMEKEREKLSVDPKYSITFHIFIILILITLKKLCKDLI